MSLDDSMQECCSKLRSTYFSLNAAGISRDCLHPLSLKKIYETVVLSKALYGSELWNTLTDCQITLLECAHRQCIKHIQNLPRATYTPIALCCLGVMPIEQYIDKRKLILLGQMCRLRSDIRIKHMFALRLVSFMQSPRNKLGFFPDIYRVLGKYGLTNVLTEYLENATFPSANSWKRIINQSVKRHTENYIFAKIDADQSLKDFTLIQSELKPCKLWYFNRLYRHQLKHCYAAIQIIARLFSRKYQMICSLCKQKVESLATHLILFCPFNECKREQMWAELHIFAGDANFTTLINLTPQQQILQLLSGCLDLQFTDEKRVGCFKLCIKHLHKLAAHLISVQS